MEQSLLNRIPRGGYKVKRGRRPMNPVTKVILLCGLTVVTPLILIGIPIYARYFAYQEQIYPLGMSDIRIIDTGISTAWCQGQNIRSNSPINVYLVSDKPRVVLDTSPVTMTRRILLDDDMKEYWGFYLLTGSVVSISTCVRWPGASMMIIQGHKHLRQCAYIGDDSSEEMDEKSEETRKEDPSNSPVNMTRIEPGVVIAGGVVEEAAQSQESNGDTTPLEVDRTDNKGGRHLHLKFAEELHKLEQAERWNPRAHISIDERPQKSSAEVYDNVYKKLKALGQKGKSTLEKLNRQLKSTKAPVTRSKRQIVLESLAQPLESVEEDKDAALEEDVVINRDGIADVRGRINETTAGDKSNSEFWSSYSSSEERLMSCKGLVLNLPLTSQRSCRPNNRNIQNQANAVSYKVPKDGYYFFVFNSENEVYTNFLSIEFSLERASYELEGARRVCNRTAFCQVPLEFLSSEKVVLQVPVEDDESRWNEELMAFSTCQPRTALYAVFIMAVPLTFVIFAFQ